jgi:hypothetical protein
MAQSVLAGPDTALVRERELGAHVVAVGVARGARLHQALARAGREHLRGRDADPELGGDRLGRLAVELAGEQRGALADGKVGEVVDQPADGLAASQHGLGIRSVVGERRGLVLEGGVAPVRPAHVVDRPVAGDLVQPRAQLIGALAGP